MSKTKLTHKDIFDLSKIMVHHLKVKNLDPDRTLILAVARGGLIPAGYISYGLGCRNIETVRAKTYDNETQLSLDNQTFEMSIKNFSQYDNIIICDDIYDTGHTFKKINEMIRPISTHCDIYNCALITQDETADLLYSVCGDNKWIVFPWDELEEENNKVKN